MRQKERMNNLFRTDVKEFVGTLNKEQEHELEVLNKYWFLGTTFPIR
jgi:hypothetical protein